MNSPHVPHCDLSPSGPLRRPTAMLSGQPQFEQCHTPSIMFACCPSAYSFSFASRSSSFARFAVSTTFAPCRSAPLLLGAGRSFSSGGGSVEMSAAVDGVGAFTFARGRSTLGGYGGDLNSPLGFSFFDGVGATGTIGCTGACGMTTVPPFSDATMFAIVSDAAAAAARRDVGAAAAAASASAAGEISGKPIAGVRNVLGGSRSGSATPRRPRVVLRLRRASSRSRSFSFFSSSLSER